MSLGFFLGCGFPRNHLGYTKHLIQETTLYLEKHDTLQTTFIKTNLLHLLRQVYPTAIGRALAPGCPSDHQLTHGHLPIEYRVEMLADRFGRSSGFRLVSSLSSPIRSARVIFAS